MNRADAVAYLAPRFAKYLTGAGRANTDTTGGLKEPIDDAFLALGYTTAQLPTAITDGVTWTDRDLRVQLEYRLLAQLKRDLSQNMNVSDPSGSASLNQIRAAVEVDYKDAEAAVLGRFGTTDELSDDPFAVTTLDLGIVVY